MWRFALLFICLNGYCLAGPVGLKRNMPIMQQRNELDPLTEMQSGANEDSDEMKIMSSLSLPSNATSIRADITDGFSCLNKSYGYYADVDNDCQIFHVCLPVTYADGKENTFRWSFICPEETIFSQDSFTCMRPDDMTISCEESYQYYELNRNFGMIDSSAEEENNNEVTANNEAESNETIMESEAVPVAAKPVVQKKEEKITGQSKPVNLQKPTRRKPSHSFVTQKKPANSYPLRKMPQSQVQPQMQDASAIQGSENVNENIKPVEEKEIKPAAQKFSRRPVSVMSNSFKEKTPNSKTENVMATRTELFSHMRKRPSMFHKKPADKLEEEKKGEEVKTETEQQNFSAVETNMPISNTETQVADTETQASETSHIFVKPEESNPTTQNIDNSYIVPEESVKVLEAFEKIPAVISERVETPNDEKKDTNYEETLTVVEGAKKSDVAEEPQIIEEAQSAEEVHTAEQIENLKEIQIPQEIQENSTADDKQTAEDMQTDENIKETYAADETQTVAEATEDQKYFKTSAEEIQNENDSKVAEESEEKFAVAQESQNDEEHKVLQQSQAADEIVNSQEAQVAKETLIPENTQDSEEPQILEDTKSSEEAQTAMEYEIAEETPAAEEIKNVEETHAAKGDLPEILQSLETSPKVTHNSEKSQFDEKSPLTEKETSPQQTEAVNESQEAEIAQLTEETKEEQDEEIQTIEAIQVAEVPTAVEEALEVDEPQPVVQNVKETESVDDSKTVEENAEPQQGPTTNDSEQHSEEGDNGASVQTIEQMESEKPAEAPESMQVTDEMSHPDAVVQQMYEDMDMNKQSVGGFKPVDPVMAHEAEQLIVDFINTLRKNDFTNETPGMHIEQHIDEEPEQEQSHIDIVESQETEKVESNEKNPEEDEKIEETADESQAEVMQDIQEVEELKKESDVVNEENKKISELNDLKSLESQSSENIEEFQKIGEDPAESMKLHQEIHEIPVKVINSPVEELPIKEEQSQEIEMEPAKITENMEEGMEKESPATSKDGYKPLSIDDIVELVKERLDHMPKTEMATPMQLETVLGEAQEDTSAEKKMEEQLPVQDKEEQQTSLSEDETVMPIYQRTVQPAYLYSEVQTEDTEQAPNGDQSEVSDGKTDVEEKTNRSYRSHSMLTPKLDSRKRRFLFRADSS